MESALITEGLPGYAPLLTCPESKTPEFQSLLGRFLRQMHDAGIIYLDISAKNVLYSASDNKFCLIDIDKAELHDSLDDRQRIDHITVFRSHFALTAAFYDGYGNQLARHAADIDTQAAALERARLERLSRVCLTHRHEVTTKRIGPLKWHVRIKYFDEKLDRVLQQPDSGAASANGFVVTPPRLPLRQSSLPPRLRPGTLRANPARVPSPPRTNAFSESSCAATSSRNCRSRNYSTSQTTRIPRVSLTSPGSSPSRNALDVYVNALFQPPPLSARHPKLPPRHGPAAPIGGPCGSTTSLVANTEYQSDTHSHEFPIMSYRPHGFAGNEPTGAVYSNPSSA